MKHRPALFVASCLGLALASGCTLDDDSGNPDPGLYWKFVCPNDASTPDANNTPAPASAPIDYVASGSCGPGGAFTLAVDGCEMFGDWAVLGVSNVETATYASSPGLGGWTITATATSGASWVCTATATSANVLTFTCSDATTSTTTCRSTLTPT
jgi:hypothetical protein